MRVIEEALGLGTPGVPFIDSSLRPDLAGGPDYGGGDQSIQERMAAGDRDAKRQYDTRRARDETHSGAGPWTRRRGQRGGLSAC